jgi:hypothetical protein
VLQEVRRDYTQDARSKEDIDALVEGRRKSSHPADATGVFNDVVFKDLVETWGP